MQTDNKFLDDMAKMMTGAMSAAGGMKDEVEARMRQNMEGFFTRMDFVRREEFEVALDTLHFRFLDVSHSSLVQTFLPGTPDLSQSLHALNGLDHIQSIVPHRLIPPLLKLQHRIIDQLLALGGPVGLGPLDLLGVALCLEQTVALGPTEPEHLGVVAHEHDAVAWVDV